MLSVLAFGYSWVREYRFRIRQLDARLGDVSARLAKAEQSITDARHEFLRRRGTQYDIERRSWAEDGSQIAIMTLHFPGRPLASRIVHIADIVKSLYYLNYWTTDLLDPPRNGDPYELMLSQNQMDISVLGFQLEGLVEYLDHRLELVYFEETGSFSIGFSGLSKVIDSLAAIFDPQRRKASAESDRHKKVQNELNEELLRIKVQRERRDLFDENLRYVASLEERGYVDREQSLKLIDNLLEIQTVSIDHMKALGLDGLGVDERPKRLES